MMTDSNQNQPRPATADKRKLRTASSAWSPPTRATRRQGRGRIPDRAPEVRQVPQAPHRAARPRREERAPEGDTVEIAECRPLSKTKHHRLVRIVVKGTQIDTSILGRRSLQDVRPKK